MLFEYRYVLQNNTYRSMVVGSPPGSQPLLPKGVYQFFEQQDPTGVDRGFIVQEDFSVPDNLINQEERVNRVLKTYGRLNKQMGVLYSGLGGTGKTVMARQTAMKISEQYDMPILLVNRANLDILETMMHAVKQPCVIFVDEFEKLVKDPYEMNRWLTVMDGVNNYNHLFLLTCNETDKLPKYLFNRPSRIRYYYKFDGLDQELIESYIRDNYIPVDDSWVDGLISTLSLSKNVTFDLLIEIVRECNFYPDVEPCEIIKDFNARFEIKNIIVNPIEFEYEDEFDHFVEKYKLSIIIDEQCGAYFGANLVRKNKSINEPDMALKFRLFDDNNERGVTDRSYCDGLKLEYDESIVLDSIKEDKIVEIKVKFIPDADDDFTFASSVENMLGDDLGTFEKLLTEGFIIHAKLNIAG